jgi:succinylglutamate desuccinylase
MNITKGKWEVTDNGRYVVVNKANPLKTVIICGVAGNLTGNAELIALESKFPAGS